MKWISSRRGLAVLVAAVALFTIALGTWQGWLARAAGDVIWVNDVAEAGEPAECATAKPTIAAALADVNEAEDTIRLCKGTYAGNVDIDKAVTVEGDTGVTSDQVVVSGSTTANAFTVKADNVRIKHVTLDGDNKNKIGVDNSAGHDDLLVKDVVIKDFSIGVKMEDAQDNVVEYSDIHTNTSGVVMLETNPPAEGGNVVRRSTIDDNGDYGIKVDGEYDARIEDNSLSGNGTSQILIDNSNKPTQVHIWRNKITIASDGIAIVYAPAEALIVIGGSEDNRNEFVGDASSCAGGAGTKCFVRLDCVNSEETVDATHNNWGGASGEGEVTQRIWGDGSDCGSPPAAAVVYRPWTTAAVPTPTPPPTSSPTATATATATPPAGTRDVPLDPAGWHNFVWSGASGTAAADAFSCIADKFGVAYRLTYVGTTPKWQKYVPGRADLTDLLTVDKYDALLVQITAPGVTCHMPVVTP